MTDRDSLNSNGDKKKDKDDTDIQCDAEESCSHFTIESEEMLDEGEKERWRRDARKYENIIDQLFDENEGQNNIEK